MYLFYSDISTATTPAKIIAPELLNMKDQFNRQVLESVHAYAEQDRLFFVQLENDFFMRNMLERLLKNELDKDDPIVKSQIMTIIRAIKARGNFSIDQKLRLISRMDSLKGHSYQAIVNAVNQDLASTLAIVNVYKKSLSPYLDETVKMLSQLMQVDDQPICKVIQNSMDGNDERDGFCGFALVDDRDY